MLFAADPGVLRAVKLADGRELRRIETHPREDPRQLVVSPDGRSLALLSQRRLTLIGDDGATLAKRWVNEQHARLATDVAFSRDGRMLALASADEESRQALLEPKSASIRLYDVASNAEVRRISIDGFGVASVAFAPDGKTLAAGVGDRTIRFYDASTGEERLPRLGREAALPPPEPGKVHRKGYDQACAAACLAFSPDGSLLASGVEGIGWFNRVSDVPPITLWDVASARWCASSPVTRSVRSRWRSRLMARCWSRRGLSRWPGSGTWRRAARLIAGRDIPPASKAWLSHPLMGPSLPSAWPTGPFCTGILPTAACRRVGRIPQRGEQPGDLTGWTGPGSPRFPTRTGTLGRGWAEGIAGACRRPRRPVLSCRIFSGRPHGYRQPPCLECRDWPAARRLAQGERTGDWCTSSYSADGRQVITVDSNGVSIWDIATGDLVRRPIPDIPTPWNAAISPDGRLVAVGQSRPAFGQVPNPAGRRVDPIRMWEMASGKEVAALHGHTDISSGLAFSADGRMLASVSGGLHNAGDPGCGSGT